MNMHLLQGLSQGSARVLSEPPEHRRIVTILCETLKIFLPDISQVFGIILEHLVFEVLGTRLSVPVPWIDSCVGCLVACAARLCDRRGSRCPVLRWPRTSPMDGAWRQEEKRPAVSLPF